MIIAQDFVFVLPPKSASSSISHALRDVGIHTIHRHEPLLQKPWQKLVVAVHRPRDEILKSAKLKEDVPWIVYSNHDIREVDFSIWFRYVNFKIEFDKLEEGWEDFCQAANLGKVPLYHLNKGINYVV